MMKRKMNRWLAGLLAVVMVFANVGVNVTAAWADELDFGIRTDLAEAGEDGAQEDEYDCRIALNQNRETGEYETYEINLKEGLPGKDGWSAELPGVWSGDNNDVLQVNEDGSAEVLSPGKVTVTFTCGETETEAESGMTGEPESPETDGGVSEKTEEETAAAPEETESSAEETTTEADAETEELSLATPNDMDKGSETTEAEPTEPETAETAEDTYESVQTWEWSVLVYVEKPMDAETMTVSDFEGLKAAINNDAEKINITAKGPIVVTETLVINHPVTITGGTLTRLEANSEEAITILYIVGGGDVTLENVKLEAHEAERTSLIPQINSPVICEGKLTLEDDAVIKGFVARRGGGVNVGAGGTLIINDDAKIVDNVVYAVDFCYREQEAAIGGGVYIDSGAEVIMNGGSVSNNSATVIDTRDQIALGGGIAVKEGGKFTMNDGTISGNFVKGCATVAEGGGICIGSDSYSSFKGLGTVSGDDIKLKAGTISNNTVNNGRGGGIYIHNGTELVLKNVVLERNDANCGAGVWYCDVGDGKFYATKGALITENSAKEGGDDFYSSALEKISNKKEIHLPTRLPDGTPLSWYKDGVERYNSKTSEAIPELNTWIEKNCNDFNIALHSKVNGATNSGKDKYTLFITGNHANGSTGIWSMFDETGRGGGIACNGTLIIGEPTDTQLTVKKVWVDADGTTAEEYPDSITVELWNTTLEKKVDTATLNNDNKWEYTFYDWPSDQKFEVKEVEVNGWKQKDAPKITGDDTNGYTVTLENRRVEVTSVAVKKTWVDDNYSGRPGDITVRLMAGKDPYLGENAEKILKEENGWMAEWTDLPTEDAEGNRIVYSVQEVNVPGYQAEVTGSNGNFEITNTLLTSLSVKKVWKESDETEITDTASLPEIKVIVTEVTPDGNGGSLEEILSAPDWSAEFEDLKVGSQYEVKETIKIGDTYYSAEEAGWFGSADHTELTLGNGANVVTLTNKRMPTQLTIEKTWVQADGAEAALPDAIKVTVLKDGEEYGSVELNAAGGWKQTITNLPIGHNWTVKEAVVNGWQLAPESGVVEGDDESGYTVALVNERLEPEVKTVSLAVIKVWRESNGGDAVENLPASITVHLYRVSSDGTETAVGDAVLTAEEDWQHVFDSLAPLGEGESWKVTEDSISGWNDSVSAVSGDAETGYAVTVTNTRRPTETTTESREEETTEPTEPPTNPTEPPTSPTEPTEPSTNPTESSPENPTNPSEPSPENPTNPSEPSPENPTEPSPENPTEPVVEIEEEEVPLADFPPVEIVDEAVPLTNTPSVEIFDEDVPLAATVPKTGDEAHAGLAGMFALVALGMMGMFGALSARKKDDAE